MKGYVGQGVKDLPTIEMCNKTKFYIESVAQHGISFGPHRTAWLRANCAEKKNSPPAEK
jgi:hypothetical protein